MANPQRGEVDVTVGDTTYTLALDLNAMCELEDVLSTPEHPISFQDVTRGMVASNMRYVRAFIWATLRRHHKEITLLGVSDLIQAAGGLEPFVSHIKDLMAFTRPDARDARALKEGGPTNGRPPEAAPSGTGTRSTSKRA